MHKQYDAAYFEKWYRDPTFNVGSRAALRRKVQLAIGMAEYYLGRSVRTVLDVGCGEGAWRAPLMALRPKLSYLGLDSSEYVVNRYGKRRDIRLARFEQLGELRFDRSFDLMVCSDVLHYLKTTELRRGLRGFAEQLDGVAFLEVFTARDAVAGDRHGFIQRQPNWYLKEFAAAGLIPVGSHCYIGPRLKGCVAALEGAART